MKYLFMASLIAFTLVSCGNDGDKDSQKKEENSLELLTSKDKWSYSFGYQSGNSLMSAQNPNKTQFANNKEHFIKGFKDGFRELAPDVKQSCVENIRKMTQGSGGSTFDATYAKEGCNCIGLLTANDLYNNFESAGATSILDIKKVEAGFEDGVNEKAKRVSDEDFQSLQGEFQAEVQKMQAAKAVETEAKFKPRWEEIKAIEGIQELDKGIYLETLKKGTGAKPAVGEDVEASYVLRDFDGNIKETSEKQPNGRFQANLSPGSLIEGWVIGFQSMREGGKYRLYVPSASAYGQEPLDFEIEFFKKAPGGTLVTPRGPAR